MSEKLDSGDALQPCGYTKKSLNCKKTTNNETKNNVSSLKQSEIKIV